MIIDRGVAGTALVVSPPYRLDRTLLCGQCFRWRFREDPGPTPGGPPWILADGVVGETVATVTQQPEGLRVAWQGPPGSLDLLARHLGLDEPLAEVEAELARDPVLKRLLPYTSGIALMRQDPWECLVSYVISAFNNIPKIEQSVWLLCIRFGKILAGGRAWSFPRPERLAEARLDLLRDCLLGYRAPYVRALARLVAMGDVDLERIAAMPYDDARRVLMALPGVGGKVADCVLLFACGHREAFPVDVWVQRAAERWYFHGRRATPHTIRAWARDRFGLLAGYAQQHLFAGARMLSATSRQRRRVPGDVVRH